MELLRLLGLPETADLYLHTEYVEVGHAVDFESDLALKVQGDSLDFAAPFRVDGCSDVEAVVRVRR